MRIPGCGSRWQALILFFDMHAFHKTNIPLWKSADDDGLRRKFFSALRIRHRILALGHRFSGRGINEERIAPSWWIHQDPAGS